MPEDLTPQQLREAPIDQLNKWAQWDSKYKNRQLATEELARRGMVEPIPGINIKPLPTGPFDPRKEVSADAEYIAGRIVKHLWIIFVLLPFVVFLFYAIVTQGKFSGAW